jgi:hypothetical protein
MKISDHLAFEADGTELVLLRDGNEVHRVECQFQDIARDAAADYRQQMLDDEDGYEGTVEDAIGDAKYVMNWTKIFTGMGVALGRAAVASERLSRSPL